MYYRERVFTALHDIDVCEEWGGGAIVMCQCGEVLLHATTMRGY